MYFWSEIYIKTRTIFWRLQFSSGGLRLLAVHTGGSRVSAWCPVAVENMCHFHPNGCFDFMSALNIQKRLVSGVFLHKYWMSWDKQSFRSGLSVKYIGVSFW